MDRKGFMLKIKPGVKEAYKARHDNIWPEMKEELKKAGIRNYTIWMMGDDTLFGYYECDDLAYTEEYQLKSAICDKWEKYMSDMIATETLEDGTTVPCKEGLDLMFFME